MKRKKIPAFWFLNIVTVFLCFLFKSSVMAETITASEYFPLESGMVWTHLEDGLNTITLSVLPGSELVDGVLTKVVQQTGGEGSGTTVNYSNDANGIREHKEFSPHVFIDGLGFYDISVVFNPPMKYANATSTIGDLINSTGTAYFTIIGIGTFPLNYNSSSKITQFENITVPLGSMTTIKLQYSLTISGFIFGEYISSTVTVTYWLSKYVGIIKAISVIDGEQSTSELIAINFQPFISADFTADLLEGFAPQTINFFDQSDGNIVSWLWSFGDGGTSTLQNPTHTYTNPGTYSVSLTVSGLGSSDAETKTDYIEISSVGGGDIDTDNDGMPNCWEELYEGLDPLVDDADGDLDKDGFSNYEEYVLGSDPTDRNDPRSRAMPWIPLLLE